MKSQNMNSVLKKHGSHKWRKTMGTYWPSTTESNFNHSKIVNYRAVGSGVSIAHIRRHGNHTNHGRNQFLKKTKMLTDMQRPQTKSHSFTVVVTIGGIFLFLTMAITAAVIIFCKKKNSVFALQKSEQESDYELDEINTDSEMADIDLGSDLESSPLRSLRSSSQRSSLRSSRKSRDYHDFAIGAVHQPLFLANALNYDSEDSPIQPRRYPPRASNKPNAYQKMVVTAVLERPCVATQTSVPCTPKGDDSDTDHVLEETLPKYLTATDISMYYKVPAEGSDIESECDTDSRKNREKLKEDSCFVHLPVEKKYSDEPPSYESVTIPGKHHLVVNLQNCDCRCHNACKEFKSHCMLLDKSADTTVYTQVSDTSHSEGAEGLSSCDDNANTRVEEKLIQNPNSDETVPRVKVGEPGEERLVPVVQTKEPAVTGLVMLLPSANQSRQTRQKNKRTTGGVFGVSSKGYYYQRTMEHDNDAYDKDPDRFSI